jgi:hypothetical protein
MVILFYGNFYCLVGKFSHVLVCCSKKNLATLFRSFPANLAPKFSPPFSTNRGIALPSKSARDAQTKNFPKLPKAFRVGLKKFSRG